MSDEDLVCFGAYPSYLQRFLQHRVVSVFHKCWVLHSPTKLMQTNKSYASSSHGVCVDESILSIMLAEGCQK